MWKWPYLKSWSPIGTKLGFIDMIWELSYVHVVKGHIPRSKICSCSQRSYTKVRGLLRSSCKMGWNVKMVLLEKLKSTFICSCSQKSYTKVKDLLRSSCRIGWKCENGLIWKADVRFQPNWGDLNRMLICVIHKLRRQATLVVWGSQSIFILGMQNLPYNVSKQDQNDIFPEHMTYV